MQYFLRKAIIEAGIAPVYADKLIEMFETDQMRFISPLKREVLIFMSENDLRTTLASFGDYEQINRISKEYTLLVWFDCYEKKAICDQNGIDFERALQEPMVRPR